MPDSEVLTEIVGTLGEVKSSVNQLTTHVANLNGRSVKAIEKLATHEERFVQVMERLENIEQASTAQPKSVTWRDVKVGSLVLGGLWSVVQAVAWGFTTIKSFL